MSQNWKFLFSGKLSGHENMFIDEKLFLDYEQGSIPSTLRIYGWTPPCITYGYSQDIKKFIDQEKAKKMGWEIVKRPTGGGIVFHFASEVSYSLVTAIDNPIIPQGLVASYQYLSEAVLRGLEKLNINAYISRERAKGRTNANALCFTLPLTYEIKYGDKKLVGSAQKRGKKALLQQGSIQVNFDDLEIFDVIYDKQQKEYLLNSATHVFQILDKEIDYFDIADSIRDGFSRWLGIEYTL